MKRKLLLQDLTDYLVQRENIGKRDADVFVRAFFEVIEQGLLEDNFVKIKGFGTFKLVEVSERESVNINTGERFQISGHTKVTFTPDAKMKELVNKPFAHFETVDLSDDMDVSEFEVIDLNMATEDDSDSQNDGVTAVDESAELVPADLQPLEVESESGNAPPDAIELHAETTDDVLHVEARKIEIADVVPAEAGNLVEDVPEHEEQTDDLVVEKPQSIVDEPQTETETANPHDYEDTMNPAKFISFDSEKEEAETAVDESSSDDSSGEAVPLTDEGEESASSTAAGVDEEIHVTAPRTINPQTEADAPDERDNAMGYTYVEVPSRRKRNWWKVAVLFICQLLIMAVCYFAGYYRLLCPCSYVYLDEVFGSAPTSSVLSEAPSRTDSVSRPAVSTTKENAAVNGDSLTSQPPASNAKPADNQSDVAASNLVSVSKNGAAVSAKPDAADTSKARPKFHVVRVGDNLSKISRKYYGSDSMVPAIVKHNKLKDANNVHLGMKLQLP